MINLIPNQEKKKMVKSFYYRFVVLCLVMLCLCVALGILLLLPAYLFSSSKNNVANQKLDHQKNAEMPLLDQETSDLIKNTKIKLDVIDKAESKKFVFSDILVKNIISKKNSNIKITQITYDNTANGGKKISIGGVASSRDILLSFRRSLEADATFKSVDLPISNFVKDSDIQFYLSLIPA